ncbi:hypothetical protein D9757_013152 [Collybiopsis confluens]|uniref:Uncharacterized protein n=1 Tax=Collybiopsis confluens TaxID=2823264 RepID=A0A8H5D8A8_9AGAR|nr:hypothetical protein D9757_013152 [Collybiopsis confluens]
MSETSVVPPGGYAIKNVQTSNYIVSHSTDKPGSIIRTARRDENGTLPAFTFYIAQVTLDMEGYYSVTSRLTGLHIGIAQPVGHLPPVEWAPTAQQVAISYCDGRYIMSLSKGLPPVGHYVCEKGETRELAVSDSLNEAGTEWVLEKVHD